MNESVSACRARVRKEAEGRRKEVYRMRDEETRAISSDWKEGFAKLKAENDERQERNKTFVREQLTEINDWLLDALVGCQK